MKLTVINIFLIFHQIATTLADMEDILPCNPLHDEGCEAHNVALASSITEDFLDESPYFEITTTESGVSNCENGLKLTMNKRFDNPSVTSKFYIMFGKVEVALKAAKGVGIVSSFYLQSDDLDEIDFEWFGGDSMMGVVQSNFFSKGNTTTYDRGGYHRLNVPAQEEFHTYTIDWTSESLTWYIDGAPVRTLRNDSADGYPQSPMTVKFSLWAGGDPSNERGTIMWAGGETQFSTLPTSMLVKNLAISDYSSGLEYTYGDSSGDWHSIKSKEGEINGRIRQDNPLPDIVNTIEDLEYLENILELEDGDGDDDEDEEQYALDDVPPAEKINDEDEDDEDENEEQPPEEEASNEVDNVEEPNPRQTHSNHRRVKLKYKSVKNDSGPLYAIISRENDIRYGKSGLPLNQQRFSNALKMEKGNNHHHVNDTKISAKHSDTEGTKTAKGLGLRFVSGSPASLLEGFGCFKTLITVFNLILLLKNIFDSIF